MHVVCIMADQQGDESVDNTTNDDFTLPPMKITWSDEITGKQHCALYLELTTQTFTSRNKSAITELGRSLGVGSSEWSSLRRR